jgi:ATP-dependent RNA helicase RhlE
MTPPSPFARLGLIEPLLRAVTARAYPAPTPIQARAIPLLLAGRDLLGIAQTGTGKTAAFALPMLQRLSERPVRPEPRRPRALVLAPTRELASQIAESFRTYGRALPLRCEVVYGGVGMQNQVRALQRGIDVLVATPGRLLDHMQQRHVDLSRIEILVLDEADRMLDMGFVRDVERILATLPKHRQSLLFSATMPTTVAALARNLLHHPERVEVTPPAATVDLVAQSVCFVSQAQKRDLLVHLLQDPEFARTLVFTRTKHGADRVQKQLAKSGIEAKAIHGNKSQGQRERTLGEFRSGKCQVLIATDLAARGIDVPEVSHVVNFDLPNIPESYVHRIGRTARAGREGIAISFCSPEEREFLRDIEKLIRQKMPVQKIDGFAAAPLQHAEPARASHRRGGHARVAANRSHGPRHAVREVKTVERSDWAEIARSIGEQAKKTPPPLQPHAGGHRGGQTHDGRHDHRQQGKGQHGQNRRRGPAGRRRRSG